MPVGLAFMAHFTSSVGDWMTTTMETALTVLPSSLKFGVDPATTSPGETRGCYSVPGCWTKRGGR